MQTITKIEEIQIINDAITIMNIVRLLGMGKDFKTALALKVVAAAAENQVPKNADEWKLMLEAVYAINEVRVI